MLLRLLSTNHESPGLAVGSVKVWSYLPLLSRRCPKLAEAALLFFPEPSHETAHCLYDIDFIYRKCSR